MKTTLTLTKPSDDELDGAFAEHVIHLPMVGLEWGTGPAYWYRSRATDDGEANLMEDVPRVTRSFDAVLPYLIQASSWFTIEHNDNHDRPDRLPSFTVHMHEANKGRWAGSEATDASLARAAVIALLRANGVIVNLG